MPMPAQNTPTKTVSQAIADIVLSAGIDVAYCLPGEETIDLLDAFDQAGVELVVTRHEQHAAFMAATHGRLTNQPGVVVTTLGPGATNAMTGLAHAQLCGFPLVMICGQKAIRGNDEGSFQLIDFVAAAQPVTKLAQTIADPSAASSTMIRSLLTASQPRQGAVVIEVPEDVAREHVPAIGAIPHRGELYADDATVSLIGERIDRASRPIVLAGSGAQNSAVSRELSRFAETAGIGVVATQMGKGAIAEDHPMSLRSLGSHGVEPAGRALAGADLVLAVGYHPVEHPPLAWNTSDLDVVHIDDAIPHIEAGYVPKIIAQGHAGDTLARLSRLNLTNFNPLTSTLRSEIERELATEDEVPSFPPSAYDVAVQMREVLDRDDIVTLDNGIYKLWFARHYPALEPNTLLLDNALATMGAGLAAGTTAARLHPDRHVVAVCGDGGFLMNAQDLATASRMGLGNLTIVVLHDSKYGFIAHKQELSEKDHVAIDLHNPDFSQLASSFGIESVAVTKDRTVGGAIEHAKSTSKLTLVSCPLDQSRNDEFV